MSDAQRRSKALEARRTGVIDAWCSPSIRKGLVLGGKPFPVMPPGTPDSWLVWIDGAWAVMPIPVDDEGRLKITLDPYVIRLIEAMVTEIQNQRAKSPGKTDKRVRVKVRR